MTEQNEKDLGTHTKTVAIDFDGVIHSYVSGWTGPNPIDPPVPGAAEAIREYLDEGFEVVIYSTRAETPEGRWGIGEYIRHHVGEEVLQHPKFRITSGKPIAVLYIDDRGFMFQGRFPTPDYLRRFAPWKLGGYPDEEVEQTKA